MSLHIYIDADACPVKDETYKVAERHGVPVTLVSNTFLRVPQRDFIRQIVVDAGADAADDYIAAQADAGSLVVTADILLAERCLKQDARVIDPRGKLFTEAGIGAAVATRALMEQLRSTGDQMGEAPPFSSRDRSVFLQKLHLEVERMKREEALCQ
jgi:uncharacterized protein